MQTQMKNEWVRYINGNYTVELNLVNGTKIRENDDSFFKADFPECCDYKITNNCAQGCSFCHENSTPNGKHGDILGEQGIKVLESFHEYTELAIGGGDPLSHPDLIPFLRKCKELNLIPNMTVHQFAFMKNLSLIDQLVEEKLIYGIGVSLVDPLQPQFLKAISKYPNLVLHVINGIVSINTLRILKDRGLKILILGYKNVRRGETYIKEEFVKKAVESKQNTLYDYLNTMIDEEWFSVISFDNLAIQQLNPKRLMSEEAWKERYMGDDGLSGEQTSASMYIDAVEMKFARNSCDVEHRYDIENKTVTEMYQFLRDLNSGNSEKGVKSDETNS